MAIDTKGKLEIEYPKNCTFLWKYIDIHRLIDFLSSKELHYNRLDLFSDPIEGLKTSYLRRKNLTNLINSSENDGLVDKIKNKHPSLLENTELKDYFDKSSQNLQFVNCWFHDNRESMAMWDLYSNQNSVALKIETKQFLGYMDSVGEDFIRKNGSRLSMLANLVEYLPLNPFDPNLPKQKRKFAAFKKDESFKHEQEYRLLIYIHPNWYKEDNIPEFFKLKIDFKKLHFNIICHPLMEKWKKNNVESLVKKYSESFSVNRSQILLKK